MTPRTRALYAFGESPRQTLREMNEMINRGRKLFQDNTDNLSTSASASISASVSPDSIVDADDDCDVHSSDTDAASISQTTDNEESNNENSDNNIGHSFSSDERRAKRMRI